MKKIILITLFLSSISIAQNLTGLDGGLEGTATIDNTTIASSGASGVWQKANANQTISQENSIFRSGSHSLKILNTSTTGRRVYTPIFSSVADGSRLVLQYYRRIPSGTGQENQHGVAFPTEALSGTYASPSSSDTWEKVTYVPISTSAAGNKWAIIMHRLKASGDNSLNMYIDDLAVYVGTSVDNTAPDPPTSPTASQGSNNGEINVSWTAPGTGVDNGGYLVIRKDGASPTGTPNVNGIYAMGNTIGDGTVAYVGTSTSFTDASLTVGHTYYYTVYSYDKAYNYCATPPSASSSQPLPVELTSFTSNVIGNKVELDWKTATEVNNYGFEIERRQTGNVKGETWEKIGFVQGHGNSNSPKSYSFTDEPTGAKEFNYRLKQIDNDGTYEYSDIVTATLENVSSFVLEQNFPNPFNPTTKISYTIPEKVNVKLKIYDMIAQQVAELVNGSQEAGHYQVTFDGSNLPSGVYFYKLEAGKFVEVKKFMLVK